jgi:hypothetical protein
VRLKIKKKVELTFGDLVNPLTISKMRTVNQFRRQMDQPLSLPEPP